jgi:hypothetical protein
MLLAGGVWFFGSAWQAALVINVSLAALIPVLAYRLGRQIAGRVTGLAGAMLLMVAPLLIIAFSMESYLYVALILAAMVAYTAPHLRLAGVLVGLTALVRGDAVFLGACMLSYDVIAHRRLRWQLIVSAIGLPALWYGFAALYYGDPFPATLGAKVAQGEFNWLGQNFGEGLAAYLDNWIRVRNLDGFYLFPPLIALGILGAIWAERPWLIMIGRDVLYVTTFVVLAVPSAEWYYAPLMPGLALLTGRGIQLLGEGLNGGINYLRRRWHHPPLSGRSQRFISAALLLSLITPLLLTLYPVSQTIVAQNPNWKAQVYPDTARWLAANTNASANFATIDIGHLGYWSKRPIIDIVGLAQPDVAAKIAEGDFGYAIRHYQPDMVLIGFSWLPEIQSKDWFQSNYVPRHYFRFGDVYEPLVLFSRPAGVKVQPEISPIAPLQRLDIDFNQQLRLKGYQLNQPLGPGMPLTLTLFWQATAPIEVDFTVFVQLVDATNTIVAQQDHKPQEGFYPTPYWQPGEEIIDTHILPLPLTLPPGGYTLLLGLYEVETGQRLQILDEAGKFKSDHVRLEGIEITAPDGGS